MFHTLIYYVKFIFKHTDCLFILLPTTDYLSYVLKNVVCIMKKFSLPIFALQKYIAFYKRLT